MPVKYASDLTDWERLITALETNAADLPQLEIPRDKLKQLLDPIRNLLAQQDLHRATKQQINKDLHEHLATARVIVALVRAGLREHYGKDSEKLVEFGVQPFRGVRRSAREETEPETEEKQVAQES